MRRSKREFPGSSAEIREFLAAKTILSKGRKIPARRFSFRFSMAAGRLLTRTRRLVSAPNYCSLAVSRYRLVREFGSTRTEALLLGVRCSGYANVRIQFSVRQVIDASSQIESEDVHRRRSLPVDGDLPGSPSRLGTEQASWEIDARSQGGRGTLPGSDDELPRRPSARRRLDRRRPGPRAAAALPLIAPFAS